MFLARKDDNSFYIVNSKDFLAFRVVLVRHLTAVTAAITLACLFVEMLCYILGRLHSSCVLRTKIRQHRGKLINNTFANDFFQNFYSFTLKVIRFEVYIYSL